MYKTHLVDKNNALLAFAGLGFSTKEAFKNICLDIDKTLTHVELDLFWFHGLCFVGFEDRLNTIIETLKNE